MHEKSYPRKGEMVQVKFQGGHPQVAGSSEGPVGFEVEDWWDKMTGGSWMDAEGNPAAIVYALRAGTNGLPFDDEVVYGKINNLGHLVHTSEILPAEEPAEA